MKNRKNDGLLEEESSKHAIDERRQSTKNCTKNELEEENNEIRNT